MARKFRIGSASRSHSRHPGGEFTPREMVEHFRAVGYEAIDYSLESVPSMGEAWMEVLSEAANLAAKYDILMDFGHLPYQKVVVDGKEDKERFKSDILLSIEAAAFAGIKHAVIHPVGDSKGRVEDCEKYFLKNIEYLTPFAEHAVKHGVNLVFENMRSPHEKSGFHRYTSTAEEIMRIADYFDMEVCWDFGHAHTTGLIQSKEIPKLKGRLTVLHINDNYGGEDLHLPPFYGSIDWDDAMKGLLESDFQGVFNFEVRSVSLPSSVRKSAAGYIIKSGRTLIDMLG